MRRGQQPRSREQRLADQSNLPPVRVVREWTMTEAEFEHEVAEALLSIEDAKADNPEVGEDDVAHDVIISLSHNVPPVLRREFRERLGIYL